MSCHFDYYYFYFAIFYNYYKNAFPQILSKRILIMRMFLSLCRLFSMVPESCWEPSWSSRSSHIFFYRQDEFPMRIRVLTIDHSLARPRPGRLSPTETPSTQWLCFHPTSIPDVDSNLNQARFSI